MRTSTYGIATSALLVLLLIFSVLTAEGAEKAKPQFKPSFDCKKAKTNVEKTICSDKELAELDIKMVTLFKNVKEKLSNEAKPSLVTDQKNWMKHRDLCTNNSSCIKTEYTNRIETLNSLNKNIVSNYTLANTKGSVDKSNATWKVFKLPESDTYYKYQYLYERTPPPMHDIRFDANYTLNHENKMIASSEIIYSKETNIVEELDLKFDDLGRTSRSFSRVYKTAIINGSQIRASMWVGKEYDEYFKETSSKVKYYSTYKDFKEVDKIDTEFPPFRIDIPKNNSELLNSRPWANAIEVDLKDAWKCLWYGVVLSPHPVKYYEDHFYELFHSGTHHPPFLDRFKTDNKMIHFNLMGVLNGREVYRANGENGEMVVLVETSNGMFKPLVFADNTYKGSEAYIVKDLNAVDITVHDGQLRHRYSYMINKEGDPVEFDMYLDYSAELIKNLPELGRDYLTYSKFDWDKHEFGGVWYYCEYGDICKAMDDNMVGGFTIKFKLENGKAIPTNVEYGIDEERIKEFDKQEKKYRNNN